MSRQEESHSPHPRIPYRLNLEHTRKLGRGNAIHQLQQDYDALATEISHMTTILDKVLVRLRDEPGGGGGRNQGLKGVILPQPTHLLLKMMILLGE